MSTIAAILRSSHCRSTHHYFALDALTLVQTTPGKQLSQLLLHYYDDYLRGAKAPDDKFRDFQNHVLHVQDNHWGGAPAACKRWLEKSLTSLNDSNWKQAAYDLGVLSHYLTDPIMPLHTAQSEKESAYHRPIEWSIYKTYPVLFERIQIDGISAMIELSPGPDWIEKCVLACASIANRDYQMLIDSYNLKQGIASPESGIGYIAHPRLAQLIALALAAWSATLSRIADEVEVDIPSFDTKLSAILATIDTPIQWLVRRLTERKELKAVAAVLHELESTGRVVKNLPTEVSVVAAEKQKFVEANPIEEAPKLAVIAPDLADEEKLEPIHNVIQPIDQAAFNESAAILAPEPEAETIRLRMLDESRLGPASPIVDAPSIGPKTAKRFQAIGCRTVAQFLAIDAAELSRQLETKWITPALIRDWQDQARLVCELSILSGYRAQLLVAAGCRTVEQLSREAPSQLFAKIDQVCSTSDGRSILRSSRVPTMEDVGRWIAAAAVVDRVKAA